MCGINIVYFMTESLEVSLISELLQSLMAPQLHEGKNMGTGIIVENNYPQFQNETERMKEEKVIKQALYEILARYIEN